MKKASEIERHRKRDEMIAETARLAEQKATTTSSTSESVIADRDALMSQLLEVDQSMVQLLRRNNDLDALCKDQVTTIEQLKTENKELDLTAGLLRAEIERLKHQPSDGL